MRTRALTTFLWIWAVWSVGASVEYLTGLPTSVPGLILGMFVAAILAGGLRALRRATMPTAVTLDRGNISKP
jgi:putative effector of murein hydrolase LrgA (UPF0299 family)